MNVFEQSGSCEMDDKRTKLTAEKVEKLRDDYFGGKLDMMQLARLHNVSLVTISNAINRRTWRHVR